MLIHLNPDQNQATETYSVHEDLQVLLHEYCNLLDISCSKKCFQQKLWREMEFQYIFPIRHKFFEIPAHK